MKFTVNPDGVSIKGCTIIYAPRRQAGEYAPLATNPYRGCGHGCKYCYVPRVLRMDRDEFNSGATPRADFIRLLKKDAAKYQAAGIDEQVMLSFTTDPYHPGDTLLTREVLKTLKSYGMGFCTLTKGGTRALRDIDLFRSDRDAFATTLTSLDRKFSRKWEPDAATPDTRIRALQEFHASGIFTWVSLEPTLDVESSVEIIRETHEFVDLFKIGRANFLPMTSKTDWEGYTHACLEVVNALDVAHYFKKDLQGYLPKGHVNPMRVPQHKE